MSDRGLKDLPGQASLIGRLYTNNDAPRTAFAIKDNLGGSAAPTINNDTSQGYSVGSIWMDLVGLNAYLCFSASAGAAVWLPLTAGATAGVPTGGCIAYSGATEPTGWILADGIDRDRVTFANLHALYQADGYVYGVGDGTTTFGVPDYRGRIPVGKDDMGGNDAGRMTAGVDRPDGDILGADGGLETNTLLIANMPAHTHTGSTSSAGDHSHTVLAVPLSTPNASQDGVTDNEAAGQANIPTSTNGSHSHTIALNSTGGSDPHDNVQPSIIQNWIIKT